MSSGRDSTGGLGSPGRILSRCVLLACSVVLFPAELPPRPAPRGSGHGAAAPEMWSAVATGHSLWEGLVPAPVGRIIAIWDAKGDGGRSLDATPMLDHA